MKKLNIITILISLFILFSCQDYLDRKNLDSFDDENFWSSENNMRAFAQGAYMTYFSGYANAWAWGRYFSSGGAADEYYNSGTWTTTTATSGNGWSFTNIRRHNILIDRVDLMPVNDETKNHWRGIGCFFRAKEYSNLVMAFGDYPWYEEEIFPSSSPEVKFKDRDPMAFVAQKILEDYEYAAANVRVNDGANQINKYVVLAFMSRDLLHMGSLLKYHKNDNTTANIMFEKAKWAAEQVILGPFALQDDLRALFTQDNLAGNNDVIFYRAYETGKVTHSLITYQITEGQQGLTQRALNAFLAADGLPIKQSPLYNYSRDNNLRPYTEMYQGRDPRLAATLCDTLRIAGPHAAYALTGMCVWKFAPYSINNSDNSTSDRNFTDAPIIRLGEVLLNYAEATAELGQFNQAAADASINKLRARNIKKDNKGDYLPKLPAMTVSGDQVYANGVLVDDPDRDPSVSSLLWEIRRERWVELMQEGFRREDIKRWKMYKYMNNSEQANMPNDGVVGATFEYYNFSEAERATIRDKVGVANLYCPTPGDSTLLVLNPINGVANRRLWIDGDIMFERQYFNSVPLDQIKLYKDNGFDLTQNPGWDN